MLLYLSIVVFIFGAIIGSFLNVVALRYKTGRGLGGRSFCFNCGQVLGALELVPIASFLMQKGKCKNCKTPISTQYILVEFITGLIFLCIFLKFYPEIFFSSPLWILFYFLLFSLLVVIGVYDIKHTIIPDFFVYTFSTLALLGIIASNNFSEILNLKVIINILAGPILFLPFYLLWRLSDGRWMGFGDAKLALGAGFMLGLTSGISAIIIGFWSGALWSLVIMALSGLRNGKKGKKISLKSEIPFAPFIIFGIFIAFMFEIDLLHLKMLMPELFQ